MRSMSLRMVRVVTPSSSASCGPDQSRRPCSSESTRSSLVDVFMPDTVTHNAERSFPQLPVAWSHDQTRPTRPRPILRTSVLFASTSPQADVDDLRRRLAAARWPEPPAPTPVERLEPRRPARATCGRSPNTGRTGSTGGRRRPALNAFPQFTTTIDGQTIHFIHVRSPNPDATPLIITHGWPSSTPSSSDIIGPLTDPRRTAATCRRVSRRDSDVARVRVLDAAGGAGLGQPVSRRAAPGPS